MTVNLHSLMIQGNLVTLNRLKLDPSDILSIQFGQKVVDGREEVDFHHHVDLVDRREEVDFHHRPLMWASHVDCFYDGQAPPSLRLAATKTQHH